MRKEQKMKRKLYVDGNTVYGIDEECLLQKRKEQRNQKNKELDVLWERYLEETQKNRSKSEEFR